MPSGAYALSECEREMCELTVVQNPTVVSHPMGEGESFAVGPNVNGRSFHNALSQDLKRTIAVPSPIGWERVRVRAMFWF